jgi:hypothetical protein
MGYGIPDFQKAFEKLGSDISLYNTNAYAYPNPFTSSVTLVNKLGIENKITIKCFNLVGEKIFSIPAFGGFTVLQDEIENLKQGTYLFQCIGEKQTVTILGIKMKGL